MQLSIFLIDLFVGTYRSSSHARLEAFVIQTKLKLNSFEQLKETTVTDRLLLAFQVSNPAANRRLLTTLVIESVSLVSQSGNVL